MKPIEFVSRDVFLRLLNIPRKNFFYRVILDKYVITANKPQAIWIEFKYFCKHFWLITVSILELFSGFLYLLYMFVPRIVIKKKGD